MPVNTLTPSEQADLKLTLLQRLNEVFSNIHPGWSLTTEDVLEVILLYLRTATGERWGLSKITSPTRRERRENVTVFSGTHQYQPLTAHLHSDGQSPCPAEEALQ